MFLKHRLLMFGYKHCSLCYKAKKLMQLWNIKYEYKDIDWDGKKHIPYFYYYRNGKTIRLEYEELVDKIGKGEIK